MKRFILWGLLSAVAAAGCTTGADETRARMTLALSGQLDAGEIQAFDLAVYEGTDVTCDDSGGVEGNTSVKVEQFLGLSPSSGALELELPTGRYVFHVEAGLAGGGGELQEPVAQGCLGVYINGDRTLDLMLYPISNCGNGEIDPGEHCDDESDDCQGCATVPQWANAGSRFLQGDQSLPQAAGNEEMIAACWLSDNVNSFQHPMAWYEPSGEDLLDSNPFRQGTGGSPFDCHAIAVDEDSRVVTAFTPGDDEVSVDPDHPHFQLWMWEDPEPSPTHSSRFLLTGRDHRGIVPERMALAFTDSNEGVVATEEIVEGSRDVFLYSFVRMGGGFTVGEIDQVREIARDQSEVALAGGESGEFIVTWVEEGSDVLLQAYRGPDVAQIEFEEEICRDDCGAPSLARQLGSDDTYLLAFRSGRSGPAVGIWITWTAASLTLGDEFEISEGDDVSEIDVAPLAQGFVVAWSQEVDGHRAIYARYVTGDDEFGRMPTGTSLTSGPVRVSPGDRGDCDQPALAVSQSSAAPSSAFFVFYRDEEGSEGTGPDIARRLMYVEEGS